MPISSTETSRILADQINMFGAARAYAEAITRQYSEGAGLEDPREPSVAARRAEQSTNLGSFAARAPGMALGGAAMAAEFGFGPRILGGFMQTIHSGQQGYAAAGAAGAIGAGAAVAGAYWGMGAAGEWATRQMVTGAQERGMVNSALGQAMPGASAASIGQIAGQVESAARSGIGNIRDITQVMQQAISSGAIDTGSATEFSTTFGKLIENVRTVATSLKSTLSDAYQTMQSVKAMGVESDQIVGTIQTMRGVGIGSGLSPMDTFGAAQSGAQMARTLGAAPGQTVQGSVLSAGLYNMAQNEGMGGIHAGSQGQYTQAALRFFGSTRGNKVLGAMTTASGELDTAMASRIAGGHMSREEITAAYTKNINSPGMRDVLRSRSGELASDFISEFGPGAFGPSMRSMFQGSDTSEGSDTFEGSDTPESLKQALTGLTGRDLDAMSALQMKMPELRQRMLSAAQQGFAAGTGGKKDFGQIISSIFDRLSAPIKDKFSAIGAQFTQYSAEVLEDLTGQVGAAGPVNMAASQSLADRSAHLTAFGTRGELAQFRSALADVPMTGGGASFGFGGSPDPKTWLGRAARDYLPSAFRMGSMEPGTTFSDLPGYGMGLDSYRPEQTAAALAMMPLTPSTGRNAMYGAGAALSWAGRGFAPPGVDVPWGGKGLLEGSTRAVGGAMRGTGAITRTLGRAGSIAFPALMAYELVTNSIPEARRQMGLAGIDEGSIRGGSARAIQSLHEAGVIDEGSLVRRDLTGDLEGLTPISNTFSRSEGMAGTQQFLTDTGRSELDALIQGGGSLGGDYKQFGGRGEVRGRLRRIKAENPGASDAELMQITSKSLGLTTDNRGLAYQFASREPGFLSSALSIQKGGSIDMERVRAGFGQRVESFMSTAVRDQLATMEISASSSPARQRIAEFAASLTSEASSIEGLTNAIDSETFMGALGDATPAKREAMTGALKNSDWVDSDDGDAVNAVVQKWARLGKGMTRKQMETPGTLEDSTGSNAASRFAAAKLFKGLGDEGQDLLISNMAAGTRDDFLRSNTFGRGISAEARASAKLHEGVSTSSLWAAMEEMGAKTGFTKEDMLRQAKAAEEGDKDREAAVRGRLGTTQSGLEMAGRIGGRGARHFEDALNKLGNLEKDRSVGTYDFLYGAGGIDQIEKDVVEKMLRSEGKDYEQTLAMASSLTSADNTEEARRIGATASLSLYFRGGKTAGKQDHKKFLTRLTESVSEGGYMRTRLSGMSKMSRDFLAGRHDDLTYEVSDWATTLAKQKLGLGASEAQVQTLAGEILGAASGNADDVVTVSRKFAQSGQGAPHSPGAGGGGEAAADAVLSKVTAMADGLTTDLLRVRYALTDAFGLSTAPPE